MDLTSIWTWIKDKGIWAFKNWYIVIGILLGLLIIIWFIKKLISDIRN